MSYEEMVEIVSMTDDKWEWFLLRVMRSQL